MTDAILAILILLPVALVILLKSNAALAVLALCAGYTLDNLASSDITTGLTSLKLSSLSSVDIDLILLILPLILTIIFTSRSWSGRSKMISQTLAAVAAGIMLGIISMPFISSITDINLFSSKLWPLIQHIRASVIIFGVIYSLLLIWFSKTKEHSKKHK